MSVLTIKNLHVQGKKTLKGKELTDFSLEINGGDVVALVGERAPLAIAALSGKAKVVGGEIYFGDHLFAKGKLADYGVEFIPCDEDRALGFHPKKPVIKGFVAPLKKRKMPQDMIDRSVREATQLLDISHLIERKPRALSSQQKVRVTLGAAATRSPRMVVMENIFSITHPEYHEGISEALKASLEALKLTMIFYTTADKAELAEAAGAKIVEVN